MNNYSNRRKFLKQSVGIFSLLTMCSYVKPKSKQPNIILILTDDLGYGDIGCYGNNEINTPNIDRLANEGVRFTSFYSNAPECSPTRAALLTGRYQQRIGGLDCALGVGNLGRYDDAIRLRETHDLGLPVNQATVVPLLKRQGYNTAICGKWHLGYEPKFSPNKHGFDHAFYSIGGAMDYFHYTETPPSKMYSLFENEKKAKRTGYFTDLVTEESIKYIDKQDNQTPFFLYVSYTAPHSPHQGPDDYRSEPLPDDSPLWNQANGSPSTYRIMIEYLDKCVGDILAKLENKNILQNTMIIFMSDNGASTTGNNSPWYGSKGGVFEGGIRVPCIVKWEGVLPEKMVSDQTSITFDFSLSIIRAAGATPPPELPFDGMDIIRHIKEKHPKQKRTLFWRARRDNRTRKAVRDGELKYILKKVGKRENEYFFDLKSDPQESNNLISSRTADVKRLKELLKDWENNVSLTNN